VLLTLLTLGLLGAYSYGEAYYQHRGFTTIPQLPRAGTGKLLDVHSYSPAPHRKADYPVYIPPGYTPSRRYPVYYLLHGMPGRPQVFIDIANMDVRLDNQLSEGHVRPMILVYPDGRIGGSIYSDSEWANTPSGDYESYVIDVVGDVDHRFSTLADRQDRVIGGLSAGAYGAINVALHHLAYFASVQVWSGYFIETRTGVFAQASRATLVYNSPIDQLNALRASWHSTRCASTVRRTRRRGIKSNGGDGRCAKGQRSKRHLRDLRRRPRLAGLVSAPQSDAHPRFP
jgi:enterochelin esterase-like enzyme